MPRNLSDAKVLTLPYLPYLPYVTYSPLCLIRSTPKDYAKFLLLLLLLLLLEAICPELVFNKMSML